MMGPGSRFTPWGHDTLALECDSHNKTAARIATIPGVRVWQDGDQEKTFLFDLSLFEKIAAIVKPRKRFQASEKQLANLAKGIPFPKLEQDAEGRVYSERIAGVAAFR
jgi:hypothetical protein